jgi:hypothetical protein
MHSNGFQIWNSHSMQLSIPKFIISYWSTTSSKLLRPELTGTWTERWISKNNSIIVKGIIKTIFIISNHALLTSSSQKFYYSQLLKFNEMGAVISCIRGMLGESNIGHYLKCWLMFVPSSTIQFEIPFIQLIQETASWNESILLRVFTIHCPTRWVNYATSME